MSLRDVSQNQLTFEIRPTANKDRGDEPSGYLSGSVKIGGDFIVQQDLNTGDELTVSIADADGNVIAQGVVEVGPVAFPPIKDGPRIIGFERSHKAKVVR